MGDTDSISDELGSIFDGLDSGPAPAADAAPASGGSSVDPISLPEAPPDGEPAHSISQQVAEFMPLDRRRLRGAPALDPAEMQRWSELREQLEYALGSVSPPLGGSQRRAFRVASRLKVRWMGVQEALAELRNISANGAFIEVEQPVAPGTTLGLEIETGDGGPPLNVDAGVRWSREFSNMDGPAGMGVEFMAIEDADVARLERVVEQSLAIAVEQLD